MYIARQMIRLKEYKTQIFVFIFKSNFHCVDIINILSLCESRF